MIIKFHGKTMHKYAGHDGNGKVITLKPGETAEVSDMVGQLLQRKYGNNFSVEMPVPAPEEKTPQIAEPFRRVRQGKTK